MPKPKKRFGVFRFNFFKISDSAVKSPIWERQNFQPKKPKEIACFYMPVISNYATDFSIAVFLSVLAFRWRNFINPLGVRVNDSKQFSVWTLPKILFIMVKWARLNNFMNFAWRLLRMLSCTIKALELWSLPTIHFSKTQVILIYQMCFSTGFNFEPSVVNHNASGFHITTIYEPDKIKSEGKISQFLPSIDGSNSGE